jgi:hypothetical protein
LTRRIGDLRDDRLAGAGVSQRDVVIVIILQVDIRDFAGDFVHTKLGREGANVRKRAAGGGSALRAVIVVACAWKLTLVAKESDSVLTAHRSTPQAAPTIPLCVTVKVCPATVMVPVRDDSVELAATL